MKVARPAPAPAPAPAPSPAPAPVLPPTETTGLPLPDESEAADATKNNKALKTNKKKKKLSKAELNEKPDRTLIAPKKTMNPEEQKSSRQSQSKVKQADKRAQKLEKLRLFHHQDESSVKSSASASVTSSGSNFIGNLSSQIQKTVHDDIEFVATGAVYGPDDMTDEEFEDEKEVYVDYDDVVLDYS